ncbi:MAG TPA: hypothetical protein VKB88_27600 [Bryobacteraceae bacterium]|nr:hypothetical protein [Bryobacteraceae bacterium]
MLPPSGAVDLLRKLAKKPQKHREEIYLLSVSADSRERSLALTKCAELPPMPDPRLHTVVKVLALLKTVVEPFPDDPLTPRILAVIEEMKVIRDAVKLVSWDARRQPPAFAASR